MVMMDQLGNNAGGGGIKWRGNLHIPALTLRGLSHHRNHYHQLHVLAPTPRPPPPKMALYVDLSAPQPHPNPPPTTPETPPRETPNRSHPFSALLAVYPFLSTLARYLDHNDLYNLSSACWQFHTNLSAYRKTLLSLSLRCSNDIPTATEPTADVDFDWRRVRGGRRCARDLVKGCLRCNTPFCRVCSLLSALLCQLT